MTDHTRDDSVGPPARPTGGWDATAAAWDHATLRRAVDHGVRLFNAGAYHASHDCFEAEWYQYGAGTTESAFLHGMTQVAAGTYKWVDFDDDAGLRSLFDTALDYLVDVPDAYYGLDVAAIRRTLVAALKDPGRVEGWRLTLDGAQVEAREEDFAFAEALD